MTQRIAPYQVLFPLGVLAALLAVGVWLVQDFGWFSAPTIWIHSRLIAGGFLWSFITGFLMTAIPRMTGTDSASPWEIAIASALLGAQILLSFVTDGRWFYACSMALTAGLLAYGARRLLRAQKPIPVFFSHVILGMLLGAAGAFAHFRGETRLGIHLYHVGAVLLPVLGIGTRFFSFLSGLPSVFEDGSAKAARLAFHGLGAAVAILLFLAGTGRVSAYLGLTVVSLAYLFLVWKVQRPSDRPSALKFGMRIVASVIPLSFLGAWLDGGNFVTWFHLLFIGCFGLICFSVATRVTLAHGAYPIDLELKSTALWSFLGFLLAALVARVCYGFAGPEPKSAHLQAAALFWILAVLSWCYTFLVKIWKPGPEARPAC